jgi:hypothetical protein
VAWWKLYGNTPASQIVRYLDVPFTPSANYTAEVFNLIIRRRGTPGTLTFELTADSTGDPGTVLQTVTKTVSDVDDTISVYLPFAASQALTGSTTYHLKVYGAATDDADDHWEVLTNDDGFASLYSSDDAVWAGAGVSMYFRVTDADTKRQFYLFQLQSALYAVCRYDDGTTPKVYINGVRGTATSATSTTLTDSNLSMTADQFIGAYIRIIEGTGDGQVRQITDNTTTAFTVAAWDITPSTDSVYIVYGTDYWTEIGSTGLAKSTGKPSVADKIAYIPQGQANNVRRMRVNASAHDFAGDGTNKFDLVYVHAEGTKPQVYAANAGAASIAASDTKAWGTALAFGDSKSIGSFDFRINNMIGHNKVLHIFKEDGLYTFSNNVIEKLGANFDDVPDRHTGAGVAAKDNMLWFGWAHSVLRMQGASITDMMNWKLGYDGMGADKKGYISSIVSAVGWLFVAVNGDADNYSTILVWNGYGWHEVYKTWKKGAKILNMYWQPNPETRGRLWFDVDGDMAYMEYPRLSANPTKDSGINYHHEGVCVTATYDARDPNLYKVMSDLRVYVDQGACEVDYQTNSNVGTGTWTALGTASTSPVTDLTLDLGGVLKIRFRLRLQISATDTPCILDGWQLSGRMMPPERYQWVCTFSANSEADTYNDEPDDNPSTVYSQLQTWAINQTKLTLRSTSQSADDKVVTCSLPTKSVDWVDGSNWGGRISVALLET